MPPRFRDSALFDKGENATIKIPFTGNPKPNIVWTREGEKVRKITQNEVNVLRGHEINSIG